MEFAFGEKKYVCRMIILFKNYMKYVKTCLYVVVKSSRYG